MPKMHINKSIEIGTTKENVYKTISDFHNWREWSPWMIMEPKATVQVDDSGKSYSWEGVKVGAGEMIITKEVENERIDIDLTFLKPWKSKAKVWFELEDSGYGKTRLSWLMDSSLPFFMFWMTKMMTAFIGMDYERGLLMLKDYIETGSVPSKLTFDGEKDFEGCNYIGITTSCSMEEMGPRMSKDLETLGKWVNSNSDQVTGIPFSIYHKWDMVKRQVKYTSAFPVKSTPPNLDPTFTVGEIPKTRVYSISHTGPYRHLGNAWSSGYNLKQNKAFKSSKKIHPFELYLNDPSGNEENDLQTSIYFPIK